MVVKAGKTQREVAKRAVELIQDAGAKNIGLLVNNINNVLPYYYNYKYNSLPDTSSIMWERAVIPVPPSFWWIPESPYKQCVRRFRHSIRFKRITAGMTIIENFDTARALYCTQK